MKQVVIPEPGKIRLQEVKFPTAEADQVCIQVRASGLCGTDMHIYQGGFAPSYPVVPGHEFAGEVVAVGSDCQRIRPGMRVAVEPNVPCNNCSPCLCGQHHYCEQMEIPGVNVPGGMSEYVLVRERGVFDVGNMDYKLAAFVEPVSCVIHGQDRLRITQGDRVLVLGAGPIGILQGIAASKRGATCIDFVEVNAFRCEQVQKYGWGQCFEDLAQAGREYNIVIDATGLSALPAQAIDKLEPQGRLLLFGVPGAEKQLTFNHYQLFHQVITVMGSFTSLKDSLRAIDFIRSNQQEIASLVSHQLSLAELPDIISGAATLSNRLKILVTSPL